MKQSNQCISTGTLFWAKVSVSALLCLQAGATVAFAAGKAPGNPAANAANNASTEDPPPVKAKGKHRPLRPRPPNEGSDDQTVDEKQKGEKIKSKPLPAIRTPAKKGKEVAGTRVTDPQRLRVLVIAVDGTEPTYTGIQAFLDQIGIPYDTFISLNYHNDKTKFPFPTLNNGPSTAYYSAIVLTSGNMAYCPPTGGACFSTFAPADWTALDNFTAAFKVRTLSYYTFPEPRYGLSYLAAISDDGLCLGNCTTLNKSIKEPVNVTIPSTGTSTFPYLTSSAKVPVAHAYTYLASTVAAAGETTTPVLQTVVNNVTYTVGAIHTAATGQQYLALTMDNNEFLLHSLAFNYGLFNWVTKGLFVGARKIYLTPQVDDFFIADDLFDASVPECVPGGFLIDPTTDLSDFCDTIRIGGNALQTTATWQATLNANAQTAKFRVTLGFNGLGTTPNGDQPPNDTLVPKAKTLAQSFYWVSHTYNHENLDCYNAVPNSGVCPAATAAQSHNEIAQNKSVATTLGFGAAFDATSMITPEVSGLANPAFMSQAFTDGIRYLVSDASKVGQKAPSANTGIPNALNPNILEIPRFATNIFYNVNVKGTDTTGSETDEYNHFYGPGGVAPAFTKTQTYANIIDTESNNLLMNMLRYYAFPSMFHQSNMYIYGNSKSLLIDTIQATIDKFKSYSTLPIISLQQNAIGALLQARAAANAAGVDAEWTPGVGGGQGSITISVQKPATIDMTGVVCPATGATCETYGGQTVAHIPITPVAPVTVAAPI